MNIILDGLKIKRDARYPGRLHFEQGPFQTSFNVESIVGTAALGVSWLRDGARQGPLTKSVLYLAPAQAFLLALGRTGTPTYQQFQTPYPFDFFRTETLQIEPDATSFPGDVIPIVQPIVALDSFVIPGAKLDWIASLLYSEGDQAVWNGRTYQFAEDVYSLTAVPAGNITMRRVDN